MWERTFGDYVRWDEMQVRQFALADAGLQTDETAALAHLVLADAKALRRSTPRLHDDPIAARFEIARQSDATP